ncbi:hypothetical protein ACF0H5_014186 [Mactra antiquata]
MGARYDDYPTLVEIEQIDEIMDAMELCIQHDVVPAEDDIEDIKIRLKMEYYRRHGIKPKAEIENAMLRTGEEDGRKRERLIHMYEELISIVDIKDESKRGEFVTDLLQKDNTSEDLLDDCETKVENLKQKECIILIAGESSAGKSSFLNLLFGYDILPTHTVSCTSTITTIRYDTRSHAKIIFKSPGKPDKHIETLDEIGRQELNEIVFMKGNERHEGHDVKEVQVFLPLDILKCGLVLADTPGIGENEFLEDYLMEFIADNEILGFIYLIFSDIAGGVKEDRLLLLLKLIIEQQNKSTSGIPFDPHCALFIANRFDAVPAESRDKVKEHILVQLGKFWPQFEDSMTVFFSTKKSQKDVDANPDYVNDDYKAVLEALSNLFSKSIDRRIRASYKWMEKVLQRISHYLKTTVKRLGCTQRENRERSEHQRTKLKTLQEKADTVVRESRADVEIRSKQIFDDIHDYLSTPQAKFLLCSAWRDNEIPEISDDIKDHKHWHWIRQRVDEAFYNRLCTAIEHWEDERNKVSDVEAAIVDIIKIKLGILQEDVNNVEQDISKSNSSGSSIGTLRRCSIRIIGTLFMDIPLQLSPNVQQRVSSNPLHKMKEGRDAKAFNKDPKAWSKVRAEKLIKKLVRNEVDKTTHKGMLTSLVEQLMRRPKDIINTLELKIPSIIEANLELLSKLEDLIVSGNRHTARYEQMMVHVEGLKKSLMEYGDGYIFVNDFKTNEIKILQSNVPYSISGNLATTFRFSELVTGQYSGQRQSDSGPKGIWTKLQSGMLERDNQVNNISIKMYMPSAGVSHTFQEVAKLRCLLNQDVYLANFLGIHHTDASTPAYIFDGMLQPLSRYWRRCSNQSKELLRLLYEITEGIAYIHTKGLVHMELTSSTVTVSEGGDVLLTGSCIPRHATFPIDRDIKVDEFAYLAPEVLKNDLYVSSADIYGLGLLMYELVTNRPAFEQQRTTDSLETFTEKVQHDTVLEIDQVKEDNIRDIIRQCISISDGERPTAHDISSMLKEIKDSGVQLNSAPIALPKAVCSPGDIFRRSRGKNTH